MFSGFRGVNQLASTGQITQDSGFRVGSGVMHFKGKTVWITGASSGIGRELALQLSLLGARLILSSRRLDALEQVREACTRPEQHFCLALDLANVDSLGDCVERAWQQSGGIDILVNNGGIRQRSLTLDTPLEVDRRIMEIDYFGTVALTKLVAPRMIARGHGHIVTIASVAGKLGSPLRSAYSAAKHAIIGFMDCLRAEIHSSGVIIQVVCPGWVQTDVSRNALTASGEALGELDADIAGGIPVDEFVARMIRQLERDRMEIVIASGMSRFGYHFRRLAPSSFHRLSSRIHHKQE
jgi:dehydrogenase/reductase SDR family protein 7B